jgi:hypothetical protein
MKHLFDAGIVNKIEFGLKVLGGGAESFKALSQSLGTPISLEASDATEQAVAAIKETGGTIEMTYRTPLIMRQYLKPHKYPEYVLLKTPMPPPKKVRKMEKIRDKGIEVSYPDAPWFTYNKEAIAIEENERARRIAEAEHAHHLPVIPADRSEGIGRDNARVQRKQLIKTTKYL